MEELFVRLVESEKDYTLDAFVEQLQLGSHLNKVQLEEKGNQKYNRGRSLVA